MANDNVVVTEASTASNVLGKMFNYLALLIIIAGVALFYLLHINIWARWGIVVLAVALALGTFFGLSSTGRALHGYVQDSWRELSKVVWPNRKEAIGFTWIVCIFVIVLALFLWLIDSSLSWLFYSVILKWSN